MTDQRTFAHFFSRLQNNQVFLHNGFSVAYWLPIIIITLKCRLLSVNLVMISRIKLENDVWLFDFYWQRLNALCFYNLFRNLWSASFNLSSWSHHFENRKRFSALFVWSISSMSYRNFISFHCYFLIVSNVYRFQKNHREPLINIQAYVMKEKKKRDRDRERENHISYSVRSYFSFSLWLNADRYIILVQNERSIIKLQPVCVSIVKFGSSIIIKKWQTTKNSLEIMNVIIHKMLARFSAYVKYRHRPNIIDYPLNWPIKKVFTEHVFMGFFREFNYK